MISTVISILEIFFFLVAGMVIGGNNFVASKIDRFGSASTKIMYLLLFIMGWEIGRIENLIKEFSDVFEISFAISGFTSFFIAIALVVLYRYRASSEISNQNKSVNIRDISLYDYLKDPFKLIFTIFIGIVTSYTIGIDAPSFSSIVLPLLYLMVLIIGIKLAIAGVGFRSILLNKDGWVIALVAIVSNYLSIIAMSFIFDYNIYKSLSLSSGFGWYTLSGIYYSQKGYSILGSEAFFTDVLREFFALILIPLSSKFLCPQSSIGVAGATAMDVTLPIIEKHMSPNLAAAAFSSGAIITLLVPIFMPFFFSIYTSA